jgi:hypothetical protein
VKSGVIVEAWCQTEDQYSNTEKLLTASETENSRLEQKIYKLEQQLICENEANDDLTE